ncbi:hypothetical protein M758_UG073000 [Ceratodon purpureus]|nr:hypothetical protein M758_UG073000 [Ceratodon purpureus]
MYFLCFTSLLFCRITVVYRTVFASLISLSSILRSLISLFGSQLFGSLSSGTSNIIGLVLLLNGGLLGRLSSRRSSIVSLILLLKCIIFSTHNSPNRRNLHTLSILRHTSLSTLSL